MVSYINPANHAPEDQIGHATGVISSHGLIMEKKIKKIFFSNTM